MAIEYAVVYHARTDHASSAGINYRHCTYTSALFQRTNLVLKYVTYQYYIIHFDTKSSSANILSHFTLPMLRLLLYTAKGRKESWKRSKPWHVGINLKAHPEYSHISTHVPGFQSFITFLHHFVIAKLATSSIRVNQKWYASN